MEKRTAERAVEAIESDIRDRSGLGDAWRGMDKEIQDSVRQDWVDMVRHNTESPLEAVALPARDILQSAMDVALNGSQNPTVHGRWADTAAACRTLAREVQSLLLAINRLESDETAEDIARHIFTRPVDDGDEAYVLNLIGCGGKVVGSWGIVNLSHAIAMKIRETTVDANHMRR